MVAENHLSTAAELPAYRYALNAADELIFLSDSWLAFARENGAHDLTADRVLGRSLWEFIADDSTRDFYRQVHRRVRGSRCPIVLPSRCDSPNLRRFLRITIAASPGNRIDYESVLTEVQLTGEINALRPHVERSHDLLTLCSCCKKALIETVGWLELQVAADRLHLYRARLAPTLRYTVCPACREGVLPEASLATPTPAIS